MDIATIIGVLAGFACVGVAVLAGGGGGVFLNIPSMLIVGGGMMSATLIHFSLGQVMRIGAVIKKTLFCQMSTEDALIQQMVNFSAINRRDGALALEQQLPSVSDEFLVKGLRMVIDGQEEQVIADQLSMEIQYLQDRHSNGKRVLEFMGSSAPAFGMIGTLIGLIQMLRDLDDPSGIGVGMATALITTFYGALLANLILLPLAGKLGMRSKRESQLREMMLEGVLGLVRGESPTAIRERMQTFISSKHREELKPSV